MHELFFEFKEFQRNVIYSITYNHDVTYFVLWWVYQTYILSLFKSMLSDYFNSKFSLSGIIIIFIIHNSIML